MNEKVGVLSFPDELHDALYECAVLFVALVESYSLGILLEAPYGPKEHVGLFNLVNLHADGAVFDEVHNSLFGGCHILFELCGVADAQCESGEADESVASTGLEPGPSCDEVCFGGVVLRCHAELSCSVDEAVPEVVACIVLFNFGSHDGAEILWLSFSETGGEDDAFALLDGHFEVSGYEQVFGLSVSALAFLVVDESTVPVGLVYPFGLLAVGLHEEVGISLIELHADTLLAGLERGVSHPVFVGPCPYAAECQIRFQTECGVGVGIEQGVADEEAVGLAAEHHFLLHADTADTENPCGSLLPSETFYVFVALGAEVVSDVFVETEVELRTMLYDGLVERREQHMVLVVEGVNGDNEQAMVLADVAAYERGGAIRTGLCRQQELLAERVLKVGHLRFVEFKIGHRLTVIFLGVFCFVSD